MAYTSSFEQKMRRYLQANEYPNEIVGRTDKKKFDRTAEPWNLSPNGTLCKYSIKFRHRRTKQIHSQHRASANGLQLYHFEQTNNPILTEEVAAPIVQELHEKNGHCGERKLQRLLIAEYSCVSTTELAKECVSQCGECRAKRERQRRARIRTMRRIARQNRFLPIRFENVRSAIDAVPEDVMWTASWNPLDQTIPLQRVIANVLGVWRW